MVWKSGEELLLPHSITQSLCDTPLLCTPIYTYLPINVLYICITVHLLYKIYM